ncbi:S41 family peptidase [Ekhidna sp.]|uniref:S41 family peptidase n=1 Tax=Ekhidna sp. TaxID=2608089 RepID=UPI003B59D77E
MKSLQSIILVAFICFSSFGQTNLTKESKHFFTGKLWGFLKYYHPEVGKGTYDWDAKLTELLDQTSSFENTKDLSDYYVKWVNDLGTIEECKKCDEESKNASFLKNFDLSWTNNQYFTTDLQELLQNIKDNRFQGKNHYVDQGPVNEFKPRNEDVLQSLEWSNPHHRLLVLFRYWNYVEYFFPYKYLTDQDWDEVLKEMIPKFLSVDSEAAFHRAVLDLVVKVDDSHAGFVTPLLKEDLGFDLMLPVQLMWVEEKPVVVSILDSAKNQNMLQRGDVIMAINERPVNDLWQGNQKYVWGSNPTAKTRLLQFALLFELSDSASISFQRGDQMMNEKIDLFKYYELKIESKEKKPWLFLEDSIGYVNMGKLVIKEVDEMMEEMMNTRAIIFDLRNYPKGTLYSIARYLNNKPKQFAKFTRPDYSYPGKFEWSGESWCGKKNKNYYRGKVIILFNERTQSHAEFTCMCLQTAPNVTSIGSQTSGADGNVTRFNLFGNHYTTLSGIGVYYPDGRETQRIGIVPDIEIRPTIKGIKEGRDEVLEKAIEIARK